MGRMKLEIRKLEQNNSRQITYSKRRNGIVKKAKELAILCDIDIFLIMFSPSGKPTICVGQKSTMEEVIEKFCRLTPQERRKRKVESLEALKKTFKKTNHVVDFEDFLELSPQKFEDLKVELANIKTEVLSLQEKTRNFWDERHQVNNLTLEQTRVTEESILEKLAQVRLRKVCKIQQSKSLKEVLRNSLTTGTTEASEKYCNGEHNLSSIEFLKQPVGVHFPSISGQLIVSYEDPNIRTGQRETEYFGDGIFSVPDYMCNYKQSIVDDGSCNNLLLNMANRYGLSSFIGYPGSSCLPNRISNQPLLLKESDHKQEMTLTSTPIENSSQFFATSIDALPQQWSSNCNHTIEPLYDGLLYSWQHSTSVSDASSSSTSQQIDTFGQQEQLPNEPLQTTYGSAIGIQDMEPIV